MDGHLTDKNAHRAASRTAEIIDVRPDAARRRLRECNSRMEACEAIREIVSNLLGCEEMALFHVKRDHEHLSLIWSFGVEPHACHFPKLFKDTALPCVMAGDHYIQHDGHHPGFHSHRSTVSAVVPIRFKGEVAAALALLRLLPQKPSIDEFDREVFEVLSNEAGEPLFGRSGSGPAGRERKR